MKTINCIVCFFLMVSVACKQESKSDSKNSNSLERELRLIAIEIAFNRRFSDEGSIVLVRTPTSTHEFIDFDNDQDREDFLYMLCQPDVGIGQLQMDTAKSFIANNQNKIDLDVGDFEGVEWIRLIDESDYKAYWGEAPSAKQGWKNLLKDHPKVIGSIEVSAFGWSDDRSEAVIYVGGITTSGVGYGNFYVFRQHGNQYSCESLQSAPSWMTKNKLNKSLCPM